MQKMKQQFVDSWHDLKKPKVLAVTAMFIAIGVILGLVSSIQLTDFIRIGFSFIPNELTAMLFGPVVGGVMGGITDILKFIVKPTGPYFWGFTFNAVLGCVLYGLILYRRPVSFRRILAAKILVAVIVNIALGTYWLSVLYGQGMFALLPARIIKQFFSVPIESVIFYYVAVKGVAKTGILQEL